METEFPGLLMDEISINTKTKLVPQTGSSTSAHFQEEQVVGQHDQFQAEAQLSDQELNTCAPCGGSINLNIEEENLNPYQEVIDYFGGDKLTEPEKIALMRLVDNPFLSKNTKNDLDIARNIAFFITGLGGDHNIISASFIHNLTSNKTIAGDSNDPVMAGKNIAEYINNFKNDLLSYDHMVKLSELADNKVLMGDAKTPAEYAQKINKFISGLYINDFLPRKPEDLLAFAKLVDIKAIVGDAEGPGEIAKAINEFLTKVSGLSAEVLLDTYKKFSQFENFKKMDTEIQKMTIMNYLHRLKTNYKYSNKAILTLNQVVKNSDFENIVPGDSLANRIDSKILSKINIRHYIALDCRKLYNFAVEHGDDPMFAQAKDPIELAEILNSYGSELNTRGVKNQYLTFKGSNFLYSEPDPVKRAQILNLLTDPNEFSDWSSSTTTIAENNEEPASFDLVMKLFKQERGGLDALSLAADLKLVLEGLPPMTFEKLIETKNLLSLVYGEEVKLEDLYNRTSELQMEFAAKYDLEDIVELKAGMADHPLFANYAEPREKVMAMASFFRNLNKPHLTQVSQFGLTDGAEILYDVVNDRNLWGEQDSLGIKGQKLNDLLDQYSAEMVNARRLRAGFMSPLFIRQKISPGEFTNYLKNYQQANRSDGTSEMIYDLILHRIPASFYYSQIDSPDEPVSCQDPRVNQIISDYNEGQIVQSLPVEADEVLKVLKDELNISKFMASPQAYIESYRHFQTLQANIDHDFKADGYKGFTVFFMPNYEGHSYSKDIAFRSSLVAIEDLRRLGYAVIIAEADDHDSFLPILDRVSKKDDGNINHLTISGHGEYRNILLDDSKGFDSPYGSEANKHFFDDSDLYGRLDAIPRYMSRQGIAVINLDACLACNGEGSLGHMLSEKSRNNIQVHGSSVPTVDFGVTMKNGAPKQIVNKPEQFQGQLAN